MTISPNFLNKTSFILLAKPLQANFVTRILLYLKLQCPPRTQKKLTICTRSIQTQQRLFVVRLGVMLRIKVSKQIACITQWRSSKNLVTQTTLNSFSVLDRIVVLPDNRFRRSSFLSSRGMRSKCWRWCITRCCGQYCVKRWLWFIRHSDGRWIRFWFNLCFQNYHRF